MGSKGRKRVYPSINPEMHSSSSSAFSRSQFASSSSSYPPAATRDRSPSPPASAYFPLDPLDQNAEPHPTPDAESHFAYSTTLRKHHRPEPESWQQAVGMVTGQHDGASVPAGPDSKEPVRDTASARFAHCSIQDTISQLRTSPEQGLRSSDVRGLQAIHGYNEFSVATPEPVLLKFAKTIYESPLILLLCGSAAISAIMGNIDDAVSITIAVLIVLTVGFVQEQRSEKSLEALNKLVPHHCHVIRDGQPAHVLANELVPGDIVMFSVGDRVPADIRIFNAVELEIDESSLTGETEARSKNINTCVYESANGPTGYGKPSPEPVALADRTCIGYMGTLVRNGRGSGIVIATGTLTEFGVIFSMMQDVEEKRTPLQLSMDELAKKLSIISFAIIGVICIIGVMQHRSWLDMFTIGVSLAVAAIPEGLPIVTTVTLALGVLRMSKRKAIVKKLHSVESLGSVSVICSDKTGTLTKNEMTVTEAYSVDETVHVNPSAPSARSEPISAALAKAMQIGSVCNNASLHRNEAGDFVGQSTDVALLNILEVFGVADQRSHFTRMSERPFNSEQKFMAVSGVHATPGSGSSREILYVKGSMDAILERCKFYYVSDDSTPVLDANTRSVILNKAEATASRGLRVLGMAYGYGSVDTLSVLTSNSAPRSGASTRASSPDSRGGSGLVFVGFQAMLDPPRKGVADAISLLQSGGVQIVMITGDAEQTAMSIAKDLGLRVGRSVGGQQALLPPGSTNPFCLTGKQIDQMSQIQLQERVGSVSVFARTTPRHKMRIVEAFQSRGAVVAMTGDGVNDAPALRMADIGISMGKSGTDVAKEAADVILVDDNFTTILPAIEEGKSIFHNIQNFLSFQLSTAAAALTLITLSTMFGLSNPLNPMQILFINILMDGPPSQSLGVDPVDPAIMRRPPRKKDAPIITQQLLYRVLFSASIIVVGTLSIYTLALSDDRMSRREQTMTFTCFVFLDLVSAIQNRGLGCGITQNQMLVTTVSISFFTQLALVYVPFLQSVFQTEALRMWDLFALLGLAAVSFSLHEARRRFERGVNASMSYAAEQMA